MLLLVTMDKAIIMNKHFTWSFRGYFHIFFVFFSRVKYLFCDQIAISILESLPTKIIVHTLIIVFYSFESKSNLYPTCLIMIADNTVCNEMCFINMFSLDFRHFTAFRFYFLRFSTFRSQ